MGAQGRRFARVAEPLGDPMLRTDGRLSAGAARGGSVQDRRRAPGLRAPARVCGLQRHPPRGTGRERPRDARLLEQCPRVSGVSDASGYPRRRRSGPRRIMTVTFSIGDRVTTEAPEGFLNLSNRNARDLLTWLGLPTDDLYGTA